MHHTNKKTIKSQNRNTNTTEIFILPKHSIGFYFIVSEVGVWQMWETVYAEAQSH
jgi:hypothetical protein